MSRCCFLFVFLFVFCLGNTNSLCKNDEVRNQQTYTNHFMIKAPNLACIFGIAQCCISGINLDIGPLQIDILMTMAAILENLCLLECKAILNERNATKWWGCLSENWIKL